jgi:Tfp pilus assembly protein PilW
MNIRSNQSGQTLIALLIFMLLSILITTTAVTVTVINTQGNNLANYGELAREAAETGAENAMLQLERDPTYAGETMTINSSATATITVSGTTTRTITSVGTVAGIGTYKRTIIVTASYSGLAFTVTSWVETP